jgi:hypothetical protein
MADLTLKDCAIDDDVLTVSSTGNTVEVQIILGCATDFPWVNLNADDTRLLYDYLGEWLAARQNTGLGDK